MSHTTDESEDSMLLKDKTDSPLIEEGSSGGGVVLKKGPWTSTEDTILVDYVKKHGEGNWNAVQKHSGLFRCGKSCRLRWANHLRPNLKKGSFTMEEEKLIIELHAKMGNKWAQMATHLPGRTDNEIKNYWNTRIKRQQRAGLPLYPPDVCLQALNENQQSTGEFNSGDAHHHDLLQANSYDIPDVIFNDLKANPGVLMYGPPLPNISVSNMLTQGLGCTHNYSLMPPTVHCRKRHRQLETVFGCNGSVINELPPFDQFQNDSCEKIHRPFGLSFPYDPDPNSKTPPLFGVMPGSHTLLNGNFSASKPIYEAVKLELPSLQYSESDLGSWGTFPPLPPSLDSLDTLHQSLLPIESVQSDCLSPRKSGLLEALLHEAQTLSSAKNHLAEKSSSSSVVMPSDMVDSSTLNPFETQWNEYSDPISPLGRSAASSIFSECTPISGSSLDEPPPAETLPGFDVKTEPIEHLSTPDRGEKEISSQLEFFRPDALLGSDWFEQTSDCGKDQSIVTDTIATLLGDDICSNYKHISASTLSQGFGLGSCAWSNLPTVCQMAYKMAYYSANKLFDARYLSSLKSTQ